jgi:hypothetical protein
MDDWDWDQFRDGALNGASLGFLYSPQRAPKTFDPRRANALRIALMQRLGAKMDGRSEAISPVQQRTFVDGAVDGLTMGWAPQRRR